MTDIESELDGEFETEVQQQQDKEKKHDDGAADLEKVTDYAEEKELSAQQLSKALDMVSEKDQAQREQQEQRKKELAAVKVNAADVELLVQEFEVPKDVAERRLREHAGSLVETMRAMTD
eukprot:m.63763 g.63763  ORF g.63763 m.63763 type:complete len:120 (-) comp13500_c0_seq2:181-540(-)